MVRNGRKQNHIYTLLENQTVNYDYSIKKSRNLRNLESEWFFSLNNVTPKSE